MNNDQISLANIEKTIGSKKILSDVSFSIGSNEIVGLLGPNGAGKTTAFYIAAGLIFPDHGRVFINNKDVSEKNDVTTVNDKKNESLSDKNINNLEEVHSDPN